MLLKCLHTERSCPAGPLPCRMLSVILIRLLECLFACQNIIHSKWFQRTDLKVSELRTSRFLCPAQNRLSPPSAASCPPLLLSHLTHTQTAPVRCAWGFLCTGSLQPACHPLQLLPCIISRHTQKNVFCIFSSCPSHIQGRAADTEANVTSTSVFLAVHLFLLICFLAFSFPSHFQPFILTLLVNVLRSPCECWLLISKGSCSGAAVQLEVLQVQTWLFQYAIDFWKWWKYNQLKVFEGLCALKVLLIYV